MYFDSPGPKNTGEAVRIAVREAVERQVSHIVVASNTGAAAFAFAEEQVTHNGFQKDFH